MQVTAEKLSEFGWFPSAVSVRLRECDLLVVIDLLLTGETQAVSCDRFVVNRRDTSWRSRCSHRMSQCCTRSSWEETSARHACLCC